MLMLFLDVSGPVLVEQMPKDTTINAARYADTHENHLEGRLNAGIVL